MRLVLIYTSCLCLFPTLLLRPPVSSMNLSLRRSLRVFPESPYVVFSPFVSALFQLLFGNRPSKYPVVSHVQMLDCSLEVLKFIIVQTYSWFCRNVKWHRLSAHR